MATETASPTTVVSFDHDTFLNLVAWSDPGNATASDDSRTSTGTMNSISHAGSESLRATGFDFSAIPSDATIQGITVTVECRDTGGGQRAVVAQMQLLLFGGLVGDDKNDLAEFPATEDDLVYGGSADLWGIKPSVSDVQHATFGVSIIAGTGGGTVDPEIDHIEITITHDGGGGGEPPPPPPPPASGTLWPWTVDTGRLWRLRLQRRGGS